MSRGKKITKTTNDFKKEVFGLVSNEYNVLGEYNGNKEKIKFFHNICFNEFDMRPNDFLNGQRCPICHKNKLKTQALLSDNDFKSKLFSKFGNEFTVLDKYKGTNIKIHFKHNICNNILFTRPHDLILTGKCKYCTKKVRKTTDIFKNEVYNLVQNQYSVTGNYVNSKTKILMKHNICQNEFYVTPTTFLYGNNQRLTGTRCPFCKKAIIESEIFKFFKNKDINIIHNYTYAECKNVHKLLFDFYIPDFNLLIEYDGEQHYNPIYGEDSLKSTQKNDSLKNDFCSNNNIPLIRIPYWKKKDLFNILNNIILFFNTSQDKSYKMIIEYLNKLIN